MDKRDKAKGINNEEVEIPEIVNPKCPTFYIFLPWLPIVFLFSAYFMGSSSNAWFGTSASVPRSIDLKTPDLRSGAHT